MKQTNSTKQDTQPILGKVDEKYLMWALQQMIGLNYRESREEAMKLVLKILVENNVI